jgi:hypothetical protein
MIAAGFATIQKPRMATLEQNPRYALPVTGYWHPCQYDGLTVGSEVKRGNERTTTYPELRLNSYGQKQY